MSFTAINPPLILQSGDCRLCGIIAIRLLLVIIVCLLPAQTARAGELLFSVSEASGSPVQDAVVFATPLGNIDTAQDKTTTVAIDQIDKEYVDMVTIVQKNTGIVFPNHDNIRHHVYSFSPAKTFEIPLYLGTPREPVIFDQTGPVSLGCNIHDWMSGYIYVVDTPYFAKTGEDGLARLELPAGEYRIGIWHFRMKGPASATGQMVSVGSGAVQLNNVITLNRVWRAVRGPADNRLGGYR